MRNALPIAGCIAALLAGIFWFFNRHQPAFDTQSLAEPEVSARTAEPSNPFEPEQTIEPSIVEPPAPEKVLVEKAPAETPTNKTAAPSTNTGVDNNSATDLRAYEIAVDGDTWNDEQYERELKRLRDDPQLLDALLIEFVNENDPARKRRLASLLGHFDSPAVIAALEQMIDGDVIARASAFDVLGRLQPRSPRARALAIDKLTTGSEPTVLIGAMNALTTVGTSTRSDRQTVQQRAIELATNSESAVRQRAVSTLGNWAIDNSATEVLIAGLADSDPAVRRSSAYAFVDYRYTTPSAITVLLERAEDDSEERRTRRAAALVLRGMPLTQSQLQRLNVAAVEMER